VVDFLTTTADLLARIDRAEVERVAIELRQLAGRLFIIGNGGGAGHASHAAADFRKIAGIEAYAWGENVSDLTAYVNDHGWECSTARWLEDSRCGHGDALLVFSVGGSSRDVSANLKEAMFFAKGAARILGIVGEKGGYVAKNADAYIRIPTSSTPQVEGIQAVLWHHLVTSL
jgi:D-sedoheptulose 7-phosphate isomerase